MAGKEDVRRPDEWRKNGQKVRIVEDAWGPPGMMGRELIGTTPAQTPTTPVTYREMPLVETEEEYAEYYQDRINDAHNRQLYPLMEDLSDWMNKTLDIEYLQGENLLDLLDNGVLLCTLAKVIHEKAEIAVLAGLSLPPVPTISARCFKSAARRSFFSRDNTEKFIQFCKKLGVHENLLFESDDLVLQNKPRNVILCLMEVSRLATRFGIEPPGLVKFEREIEAEEEQEAGFGAEKNRVEEESQHDSNARRSSVSSWHSNESKNLGVKQRRSCSSAIPTATSNGRSRCGSNYTNMASASSKQDVRTNGRGNLRRATSEGARMNKIVKNSFLKNKNSNAVNGRGRMSPASDLDRGLEQPWSRASSENCSQFESDTQSSDDLDKKVQRATNFIQRHCQCASGKCEKLKIKKIGEGKYTIGGRNVFIRLLKGRHMMVRVGGGWDTLENFLARHDPCQSINKSLNRTTSTESQLPSKNNVRRYSNPSQCSSSPVDSLVSR